MYKAVIAITAAGTIALPVASVPADHPPSVWSEVTLSAAATAAPTGVRPRDLIKQFLINQGEDCSLICPFIVPGAVQTVRNFAVLPITFVKFLQSGEPVLNAAALSDATVSTAINNAFTGIISNDLNKVLPRAQNALEVIVVSIIDVGTTAITRPRSLRSAINTARTNVLDALKQPPGTMPPPSVHNAIEAVAVRGIEILSALTFQAPERLLLGLSQAANALFTTVGETGKIGQGLMAAGTSLSTAVKDSVGFIRHAVTEPIPVVAATAAPVKRAPTLATAPLISLPKTRLSLSAGMSTTAQSAATLNHKKHRAPETHPRVTKHG